MTLPPLFRSSLVLAACLATVGGTAERVLAQDAAAPLAAPPAEPNELPGFNQTVTPATTAGISDAGIPLPGFLTAGGAFDSATPDFVATVGAGVELSPAYFGSDEYEVGPDFAFRLDLVRFPNGFEFGSGRSVGFRTGLGVRGSVRYIPLRNSNNHDELEGVESVPWAFEAGLGLGYEQRNYRVFADVRYGVVGTNAWVGDVGADAIAYPLDGLTLTLGPRMNFGDNRFTDTYFGISNQESIDSGLDAYDAEGGLIGAGVLFSARYLLNERWGVEGAASWDRLLNDAADSPITEMGSADQYRFGVNLTRRISLDF